MFTVDISGKTLVFEAAHPAFLHRVYDGRRNIKELRLFADKVIIRSPLVVALFANRPCGKLHSSTVAWQ